MKGNSVVLCDRDIKNWLDKGFISIVPCPLVEHIHGVTVDIHLGNKFHILNEYTVPFIDLGESQSKINKALSQVISNEIKLKKNELFYLQPAEFALAVTLESVTLPNNLVGWLDGRSSLARLGLMIHITAHRIDPGWSGYIVLEFFNAGKLPLALRPGMKIGALSFESLTKPVLYPYGKRQDAKYQGQKGAAVTNPC